MKKSKLRRKGEPGIGMGISPMFIEINKLKSTEGSGDLRARSFPAAFPNCKKELEKEKLRAGNGGIHL